MKKFDALWLLLISLTTAFLLLPTTRNIFVNFTNAYPYTCGFIKFFILASQGELLAIRIVTGDWKVPKGFIYRAVIWGIIGMSIVLIFGVYNAGISSAMGKGLLPCGKSAILTAFFTSSLMNLTYGPALFLAHRLSDTYLDIKYEQSSGRVTWDAVVQRIDWNGLVTFVMFKTIPFFWIPAHTVVFLMPAEYRVLVAAILSIALGTILAFSKRRSQTGMVQKSV